MRNSKSFSEAEALKLHLIDVVAADDNALLAALNGRTIKRFHGESVKLDFTHATIDPIPPSTRERLLTRLTSPDLDVLLLLCGGLLIYLEFNVPGTIVPGALGTLMMLLAIFGLNLLPVQHTAILLLFAALALMVLEAKFASHGVLGTVGILCLVFGLATLVNGPSPEMRVHFGVAAGAGVGFGVIEPLRHPVAAVGQELIERVGQRSAPADQHVGAPFLAAGLRSQGHGRVDLGSRQSAPGPAVEMPSHGSFHSFNSHDPPAGQPGSGQSLHCS